MRGKKAKQLRGKAKFICQYAAEQQMNMDPRKVYKSLKQAYKKHKII